MPGVLVYFIVQRDIIGDHHVQRTISACSPAVPPHIRRRPRYQRRIRLWRLRQALSIDWINDALPLLPAPTAAMPQPELLRNHLRNAVIYRFGAVATQMSWA